MRPERDALAQGGRVVVLLGVDEAMNVVGEMRDVNPSGVESVADGSSEARRREAYWKHVELVEREIERCPTPKVRSGSAASRAGRPRRVPRRSTRGACFSNVADAVP